MSNKDAIQKWVDLLRSGEYRKGNYYLCFRESPDNYVYSVWGVACEAAIREKEGFLKPARMSKPAKNVDLRGETFYASQWNAKVYGWELGSNAESMLCAPRVVLVWLGITDLDMFTVFNPRINRSSKQTISQMNDNGWTFEQIADFIAVTYL